MSRDWAAENGRLWAALGTGFERQSELLRELDEALSRDGGPAPELLDRVDTARAEFEEAKRLHDSFIDEVRREFGGTRNGR